MYGRRLGLPVGRVLRLAGEAGIMMCLFGRELENGDCRQPFGVLHLLRLLRDALRDHGAGTVEPGDLKKVRAFYKSEKLCIISKYT